MTPEHQAAFEAFQSAFIAIRDARDKKEGCLLSAPEVAVLYDAFISISIRALQ